MIKELIKFLEPCVTDERRDQMLAVLSERTKYLTVVLEDIYQAQNASAVLRTCDGFGIQDVHIIENRNTYDINPKVVIGASKWLDLNKYNTKSNNTLDAIKHLKAQGYRIVATTPHDNDTNLEDYDLSKGKTALVFGTEKTGVSKEVMDEADEFIKIPMFGYSESFNISVAAAVTLHHLSYQLRQSELPWQLTENEADKLYVDWLKETIKKSDLLVQEFYQRNEDYK
ncbi:TrmH family RNA methyltransferase [Carboxylicivirga sp. N1Y90]|uniref:TrmH family RNA methyltransferase n=1 Tax=Carboxylicivirga fragile TaxID=3417571 RepID=UPI003D35458A|nr:RNA methyltransferase [Marinilabiliaceae bacterium N1Y90]